ncbi:hypothetical protein MIND_00630800 [Mycena indigotica]|uniref:Uncharacterized protein n=1 Tax=Mycena indigotica TaxID=2126181 RepID=A0A8H6SR71_9AGAR|nr:uncharacterized protein MIND_00630800 [Mycena indigotica]KAF7303996.1 hypothetical protein MIND_00630800 [Mycena indigotica]
MDDEYKAARLLRALKRAGTRAPHCLAAVRQIVIFMSAALPDLLPLLPSCGGGVTHLAIRPPNGYPSMWRQLPGLLACLPHLQRLVVPFVDVFPDPFPHSDNSANFQPALPHVTHLALLDAGTFEAQADLQRMLAFFRALPALTHLALMIHGSNRRTPEDMLGVFAALLDRRELPGLRVLACLGPGTYETAVMARRLELADPGPYLPGKDTGSPLRDARFVVVDYGSWLDGADLPGLRTYWDMADTFVAKKVTGQIASSVVLVHPSSTGGEY